MATMTLDELVKQLRSAYGQKLESVVLYGSAAGGDHIPNRSDYNVLVLLEAFDNSHLDVSTTVAAGQVARAWKDAGNPPPMTLTMEEWRRSADIFPMEYADILERHRVLHGDPPFEGIRVAKSDLRLQLESQVMGKLLHLRQGVLLAGTDGKRRIELIAASLSTMMVLFRAVLRLHGERPEGDNAAIASRVGTLAGFDATPFARAVRHVHGTDKIPAAESGRVLAGYLSAIDQLSHHLDQYDPT